MLAFQLVGCTNALCDHACRLDACRLFCMGSTGGVEVIIAGCCNFMGFRNNLHVLAFEVTCKSVQCSKRLSLIWTCVCQPCRATLTLAHSGKQPSVLFSLCSCALSATFV